MTTLSPTLATLLIACALFVVSPYIPSWFLNLAAGTKVGAITLLILVLFVLQSDVVLGLATFLAVASLFLEHRRRTVTKVTSTMAPGKVPFKVEDLVDAPNLVPGEVHPKHKEADVDDYSFEPTDDSGKDTFERVDESQDNKEPLETVPPQPSVVSELLQGKGLANI
jgi:hypothetical protein